MTSSTALHDNAPPFLPLEEQNQEDEAVESSKGKRVVSGLAVMVMLVMIYDAVVLPAEERWLSPASVNQFLGWVQTHTYLGLGAFLIVIASGVVLMLPIGTPLTLGCGYIYKGAYGWGVGMTVATAVSMSGSALGAVTCFLLGRYLMRERVRKWIRKYPLFDAIDVAAAEHGLKIMAMLYLTPILPLGPVSYMCGTTSMSLSHFTIAKIASLPLMTLYVFLGASTGTLIESKGGNKDAGAVGTEAAKQISENENLIIFGMVLSCTMIGLLTHHIKKELLKILEREKKHEKTEEDSGEEEEEEAAVELGSPTAARQRRTGFGVATPTIPDV